MHELREEHKECRICMLRYDNFKDFRTHLRQYHSLSLEVYFTKFFPQLDKLTKQGIPWKNYTDYYSKDFLNRSHLKKWAKEAPVEETKEYFKDLFNKDWPITSNTLKMSYLPDIDTCFQIFGEVPNTKKDYSLDYRYEAYRNGPVFVDTREKKPLNIYNTVKVKLDVGDYGIFNQQVYVERKSLTDFCSTVCGNTERFEREIIRAEGRPFVILCEFPLEKLWSIKRANRYTNITPEYLIMKTKKLLASYPNVQILFTNGKKEAARIVRFILNQGSKLNDRDLQFDYDNNLIKFTEKD